MQNIKNLLYSSSLSFPYISYYYINYNKRLYSNISCNILSRYPNLKSDQDIFFFMENLLKKEQYNEIYSIYNNIKDNNNLINENTFDIMIKTTNNSIKLLNYYKDIKQNNIIPLYNSYIYLLNIIINTNNNNKNILNIYEDMRKSYTQIPSQILLSQIMIKYSLYNKYNKALEIYNIIKDNNKDIYLTTYYNILNSIGKHYFYITKDIVNIIKHNNNINSSSKLWLCILNICYHSKQYKILQEYFNYILYDNNIIKTTNIFNLAISSCIKSNIDYDKAIQYYYKMKELSIEANIITFNNIIKIYSYKSDYDTCLYIIQDMISKNITLNKYTFITLFQKASSEGYFDIVMKLIDIASNNGIDYSDIYQAIAPYALSQKRKDILSIMHSKLSKEQLSKVNITTIYNQSLLDLTKSNIPEKSLMALEIMKQTQHKPDIYSYNILIKYFAEIDDVRRVDNLYKDLLLNNIKPTIHLFTILIKVYGKNKNLDKIQKIRDDIKTYAIKPDTNFYCTLLNIYGRNNEWNKCLGIYKSIKKDKEYITTPILNSILSSLVRCKKYKEAINFYNNEYTTNNISKCIITYNILMKLYSKLDNKTQILYYFNKAKDIGHNGASYYEIINYFLLKDDIDTANNYINDMKYLKIIPPTSLRILITKSKTFNK